jgi:hypothetical protein
MVIGRGKYMVITVEGAESIHDGVPTIKEIRSIIGCDALDTVLLDRDSRTVMMVDANGLINRKPINAKATVLYRAVCQPGVTHSIYGNVVIVNDEDF